MQAELAIMWEGRVVSLPCPFTTIEQVHVYGQGAIDALSAVARDPSGVRVFAAAGYDSAAEQASGDETARKLGLTVQKYDAH